MAIREYTLPIISTVLLKLKQFSGSQAVSVCSCYISLNHTQANRI